MEWGPISIGVTIGLTVLSIVLGLRTAKKKIPVWAYETNELIGLGTDAPPELKLSFGDSIVNEVFRTRFILFNKGRETINKDDVTDRITILFHGANILRPPTIENYSREQIRFSAKQVVNDEYDSVDSFEKGKKAMQAMMENEKTKQMIEKLMSLCVKDSFTTTNFTEIQELKVD